MNSVLPLVQENKPPVFREEEKCEVLQEAFFQDRQQNNILFNTNIIDMYRQAFLAHDSISLLMMGQSRLRKQHIRRQQAKCAQDSNGLSYQQRLTVSLTKTEASLFTKLKLLAAKPFFDLDGTSLK